MAPPQQLFQDTSHQVFSFSELLFTVQVFAMQSQKGFSRDSSRIIQPLALRRLDPTFKAERVGAVWFDSRIDV